VRHGFASERDECEAQWRVKVPTVYNRQVRVPVAEYRASTSAARRIVAFVDRLERPKLGMIAHAY
jgi:hypothetical protein